MGAGVNPALTKKTERKRVMDFLNVIFQAATDGINGIIADGVLTALAMIAVLLIVTAVIFFKSILVPSEEVEDDD